MLKEYKNQLYQSIRDLGLDPGMFDFQDKGDLVTIVLRDTRLVFHIVQDPDNYHVFKYKYSRFSPDFELIAWAGVPPQLPPEAPFADFAQAMSNYAKIKGVYGFDRVKAGFIGWIHSDIKGYIAQREGPDLWAQSEPYQALFDTPTITENTLQYFTEREQATVKAAIAQFQILLLAEFKVTGDQLQDIHENLEYLADAVERLNRRDWQGLALSSIIGIVTTLSLDTATGHQLWKLLEQAFQSVVKLLH